jgi:hypothetical protein
MLVLGWLLCRGQVPACAHVWLAGTCAVSAVRRWQRVQLCSATCIMHRLETNSVLSCHVCRAPGLSPAVRNGYRCLEDALACARHVDIQADLLVHQGHGLL